MKSGSARDPRLDPYRDAVAVVHHRRQLIGYMHVMIQACKVYDGPFWRRRVVLNRELPQWQLSFIDPATFGRYADGMDSDVDRTLEEFREHRFAWFGDWLDLRWIDEPQADEIRRTEFPTRHPTQTTHRFFHAR